MKTQEQIDAEAERRWSEKGLSEAQKANLRLTRKFVIHAESKTPETPLVIKSEYKNRSKLDNAIDEIRRESSLKEVWDD